ncbi:phosphopantetheine-binding protein [Brevibacillus formosus]|uniref:phosphopantetheine-binding protein n=1 Tax=Brevibacillus TaxID=55080 RepID=UPI000D0F9704|nr:MULTISPECIES: phosphopantetheine-binding protein [Brevibacillus]MBG9945373.1 phosphopantetheine-containing protein [Brevibacillus formosus]MED1943742.1 phosphopantetheine-binding protein [Brevibacillus formosus]MED1999886.1 phosphopantetheine-binding protein [Brevibacillus formosus]MED2081977.1 phosphopantetheine-binding protein [Brevibacillus formosus]PSK19086.1 phosphopantetheine-containing protein [Brevibacillus sp. NRRL NRS-603]
MEKENEVYETLLQLFSDYVNESGELTEYIDSLTFIKSVVKVEKEFGIEFDDDMLHLENFQDMKMLAGYIQQKMDAKSA